MNYSNPNTATVTMIDTLPTRFEDSQASLVAYLRAASTTEYGDEVEEKIDEISAKYTPKKEQDIADAHYLHKDLLSNWYDIAVKEMGLSASDPENFACKAQAIELFLYDELVKHAKDIFGYRNKRQA